MVWDLTDDVPVYQFRERLHMRPASTMKCVTAIATLDKLGVDYDFKTNLYYTGVIDDSTQVLRGDLYCVGGMDPMLSSSDLTEMHVRTRLRYQDDRRQYLCRPLF